jgi:alpha-glucosidase
MHGVLRFWLERGIDGFRVDVIHCIGKDPALPNDPEATAAIPHTIFHYDPSTHRHVRGLRRLLDSFPGDRMMVGEIFQTPEERFPLYYGHGDELHLAFDLPHQIRTPWDAGAWRARIANIDAWLAPRDGWPAWVLSNHDTPRHRTRFAPTDSTLDAATRTAVSARRARAAALLLLGLRGTPFLYAGEELGLEDAVVTPDCVVDPGGRDGCRAPIPWLRSAPHGWHGTTPWLPFAPNASACSVEAQQGDEESMLALYRRAIALRRARPALNAGAQHLADTPVGVLGLERAHGDSRVRIYVNFTDASVNIARSGTVLLASDGPETGTTFTGIIPANTALWLTFD